LAAALPSRAAAAAAAPLVGDDLVHCDVRSDNLCIRGDRAVLFDWNFACVGNAAFDVAFWLPSLALEGGPKPARLATPAVAELAPTVAGFFAALAPLPPPEGAPTVRAFQRAHLEVALPWAAQVLGLPEPA
jgi:Ser/Thr protein kinase RdoA (MazF antagonist)